MKISASKSSRIKYPNAPTMSSRAVIGAKTSLSTTVGRKWAESWEGNEGGLAILDLKIPRSS